MEEVKTLFTLRQRKLEEHERKFDIMENSWKEYKLCWKEFCIHLLHSVPPTKFQEMNNTDQLFSAINILL
jgi:deoxyribodipyrimidine photolyase